MTAPILGIHHVTALAGDPQTNLDFYSGALGLRLVKKTVNFDDPGTYHFYFGDGVGSPGTIMTFFPWPGARRGQRGTGQATVTAFAVPRGSVPTWTERLREISVPVEDPIERFGNTVLPLADPDGLRLELVETDDTPLASWPGGAVGLETAITAFHGVTLLERDAERTIDFLTGPMGFERVETQGERTRLVIPAADRARYVDVVHAPDASRGVLSAGTVHHVAWRVDSDATELAWRERLGATGLHVTPVRDRQYFHSIYFREPGGVLFEIATDPPGFDFDETVETLGSALRLPPWLEPHRDQIEQTLPSVDLDQALSVGAGR